MAKTLALSWVNGDNKGVKQAPRSDH